jgi:hypothetical protein
MKYLISTNNVPNIINRDNYDSVITPFTVIKDNISIPNCAHLPPHGVITSSESLAFIPKYCDADSLLE